MDFNLFIVCGVIAAPPELRETESGSTLLRYLVTTRSESPRRVDVLTAVQWNPRPELCAAPGVPGERVWIVGAVQRRFRDAESGRRSGLELVAYHVEVREPSLPCSGGG